LIWATYFSLRTLLRTKKGDTAYKAMRQTFGGSLLLGLEILSKPVMTGSPHSHRWTQRSA
jgi:hypothetical protein